MKNLNFCVGRNTHKLEAARQRVAEMDKTDGCSQIAFGLGSAIRTVVMALDASDRTTGELSEKCLWEAIAMLEQIWQTTDEGKQCS